MKRGWLTACVLTLTSCASAPSPVEPACQPLPTALLTREDLPAETLPTGITNREAIERGLEPYRRWAEAGWARVEEIGRVHRAGCATR